MMKRPITLFVSLCLALSLWAQTFTVRELTYQVNGNEVTVVGGTSKCQGDLFIPSTVTHSGATYLVTTIGDRAFAGNKRLRGVSVVGDALRVVGASAFQGCSFLECVLLPESVVEIGDDCFNMTNVQEFDCPKNLRRLGKRAFYFSGLRKVALPASLEEVPARAFAGCADLSAVSVPDNVRVAEDAFYNCPKLNR